MHKERTGRTGIVKVPLRRPFIEQEQNLTPAFRHRWPSARAHHPRAKQPIPEAGLQDRVEGLKRRPVEGRWGGQAINGLILRVEHDPEGQVARMGVAPSPHLGQAVPEGGTVTVHIHELHVAHGEGTGLRIKKDIEL